VQDSSVIMSMRPRTSGSLTVIRAPTALNRRASTCWTERLYCESVGCGGLLPGQVTRQRSEQTGVPSPLQRRTPPGLVVGFGPPAACRTPCEHLAPLESSCLLAACTTTTGCNQQAHTQRIVMRSGPAASPDRTLLLPDGTLGPSPAGR